MRISAIGAGTIGLSWVRLFAAHGHDVAVHDPRPDLPELIDRLPLSDEEGARVTIEPDRRRALAEAEIVQESGPESVEFKRTLAEDFGRLAGAEARLLSSSSALGSSRFTDGLSDGVAARVCIGHPFNPPHVMPLVEVVPGPRTSPETLAAAMEFYRALGREPVLLAREIPGFVGNRLQKAVWAEAFRLVQAGVVSPADVDAVVRNSLGLRWACIGPFEAAQLGGGPGGMRHLMELLSESFAAIELTEPDWSPGAMAPLYEQVDAAYPPAGAGERAARRDACQEGILGLRGGGVNPSA